MRMSEILLGSHISLSSPDYFLGAAKEAFSYGENCFMFYTGAPQNSIRKDVSGMKIEEGKAFLKEKGINLQNLVIHAPYIINLASKEKEENFRFGIEFLKEEVTRAEAFGVSKIVLHPGAKKEASFEEAASNLAEALREVLSQDSPVTICLETMAGKGSEIGRNFEEMSALLKLLDREDRIGVCLDTCHVFDAGYAFSSASDLLDEFDRIIGLKHLKVLHLNDSKTFLGSHKDRHENIGYGAIGFPVLHSFVVEPRLASIPKILETPYINGLPPYQKEIAQLKEGRLKEDWKKEFEN